MIKYTIYGLLFLLSTLTFSSCKKFLEERSPDEIKPETVADLQSLMNGEAYPYQILTDTYVDLLTDDMQSNGLGRTFDGNPDDVYLPYLQNGTRVFKWDARMFDGDPILSLGTDSWSIYYTKIKGCNTVIDNLGKVSGSAEQKNALLGQVLFLRAYYYLKLVTLYGQPYSGAGIDPNVSLGVPLILNSVVTDQYPVRNTLKEVYGQIEKDLLEAAGLLKANFTEASTFRVGHIAAYSLLTRLYLYMGRAEDMDKVIQYANLVLTERPVLTQMKSFFDADGFQSGKIYNVTVSPEVVWVYGINPNVPNGYFPEQRNDRPPYTVSGSLAALYETSTEADDRKDLRYPGYFRMGFANNAAYLLGNGKIGSIPKYGTDGIRIAEVYLNRAEAYAKKFLNGDVSSAAKANADLNTLRASRYDTRNVAYQPVNYSNANDLFKFCQDERRRELCLESGHRWMDIKRWGLSISHRFIDADGTTTDYTLRSGSLIYALPIPFTATLKNGRLAQNPR